MATFRDPKASSLYRIFTQHRRMRPAEVPEDGLGELVLSISDACNMRCLYCFADAGKYGSKPSMMSFETAKRAVDSAISRYGRVNSIKFFGGEPLLNFETLHRTCEYLEQVLVEGRIERLPRYNLITNLTFLKDSVLDFLAGRRFGVTTSLDGPASVTNALRILNTGRGCFDRVDANIRKVMERMPIGIECVYTPQHTQCGLSLADLHRFFHQRYGLTSIVIHPLVENQWSAPVFAAIPKAVLEAYRDTMYDQAVEYGRYLIEMCRSGVVCGLVYSLLGTMVSSEQRDAYCGLGVSTVSVMSDGDLYPCYMLSGKSQFLMGNVRDERSVIDQFDVVQAKFLGAHKSGNTQCQNCEILNTCKACQGSMFGKWQDLNRPVPLVCDFYVGLREGLLLQLDEVAATSEGWDALIRTLAAPLRGEIKGAESPLRG